MLTSFPFSGFCLPFTVKVERSVTNLHGFACNCFWFIMLGPKTMKLMLAGEIMLYSDISRKRLAFVKVAGNHGLT